MKDNLDKKADSRIKNLVIKAYSLAVKQSFKQKKNRGFVKFKSFRNSKQSYATNQAVRIQGNRIILPKLKNGVRFKGLPKEYNNQEIAQ
ncbi:MAG: hypothetical protein LBB45_06330, partial [Methanobrevibacter sp.]|nr:hypothetical protein [Candidatus Methanovirga basalitermitum]